VPQHQLLRQAAVTEYLADQAAHQVTFEAPLVPQNFRLRGLDYILQQRRGQQPKLPKSAIETAEAKEAEEATAQDKKMVDNLLYYGKRIMSLLLRSDDNG